MEWVLNRYLKREEGESLQIKANELREKMLEEPEFQEERFLEFVKKLSHKNVEGDEGKQVELKKICQYFGRFIKNLCRHPSAKQHLTIRDIDGLSLFKHSEKWSNETIRGFILDVVPPLIAEPTFSCKDKSPLKHGIMLRAAELEAQRRRQSGESLLALFK